MKPINDPHRRKRCCKGPLSVAPGACAALRRLGTSARASIIRQMDASTAAIVGLVGVVLGATLTALLTRRNERRSHSDELLAQAVNDAIDAIADVAAGTASDAPGPLCLSGLADSAAWQSTGCGSLATLPG